MIRVLGSLFVLSLVAQFADAEPITGVTPSSSMGTYTNYNIANLTNGLGLTSYTGSATHNSAYSDMWLSNGAVTGTVKFALGGTYTLNTLDLWNFNYDESGTTPPNVTLTRGVQDFNVEVSTNGTSYTTVLTGQSLAEGTGSNTLASQSYALGSVTASYVEIVITSNWGDTFASGLSAVLFDGTPVAIPEPSSFLLTGTALLAGLASVAARRFKARLAG